MANELTDLLAKVRESTAPLDQATFDRLTAQSEATISARVLADSVNPRGTRLTTMEWTYPRMIHSEIMTHRMLSRNSASSRAIPLNTMLRRVLTNPMFPLHWGKNQKGMQADQELSAEEKLQAAYEWIKARNYAVLTCVQLEKIGIHKQIGNRLLEPWMWITVIVSATNFENLFALRCHKDAEPHFQKLAYKVRSAYDAATPREIPWGGWHLPLIGFEGDELIAPGDLPKISAGRCARVSYLTHEGKRDPAEDVKLYERLSSQKPLHASPLEHPAQAQHTGEHGDSPLTGGNFAPGWMQFRKMHVGECVTTRA